MSADDRRKAVDAHLSQYFKADAWSEEARKAAAEARQHGYMARGNVGRTEHKSEAHESHQEAARSLFEQHPKMQNNSTSKANYVNGKWIDPGFDIRFHKRHHIMDK